MERPYQILCLLTIVAAPVLIGGVHTQAVLGLVGVSGVAAITYLLADSGQKTARPALSIPSLAFFGFALVCLLQLVPLPAWLVDLLSPRAAARFSSGWELLGAGDDKPWRPLTLDPRATADRGLRWVGLGLACLLAVQMGRSRRRWTTVLRTVVSAGWIHLALSALPALHRGGKLLGFYEPQGKVSDWTLFVNANHAAAFYGLCCLAAIALATRRYSARPLEATAAAASGATFLVLTTTFDSSATLVALGLALLLIVGGFAARVWNDRFGSSDGRWANFRTYLPFALLATALSVMTGLWAAGLLDAAAMTRVVGASGAARVELVESGLEVATEYPLLGSGAGSVERVISPYIDWSQVTPARIGMLENEPVEWIMTLGWLPALLGAGLCLLALGYAVYKAWTTSRQRYVALAAIAIYMLVLVQFHFPLFTYGLALPFIYLFETGLRAGKTPRSCEGRITRRWIYLFVNRRIFGALLIGSLTLATVFAGAWFSLSQVYGQESVDTEWSEDRLRQAARYIPTESRLYAVASLEALQADRPTRAVALARYAYQLEPRTKELFFLARVLAHAGRQEASLERYAQLFDSPYSRQEWRARRWISKGLLVDIESNAARARVLGPNADLWQRALVEIEAREGRSRAIDFALELTDAYPNNARANDMLISQYVASGQYQLAQMMAESQALATTLDADMRARAYGWLVRTLAEQDAMTRAWKVSADALAAGLGAPMLYDFVLAHLPEAPASTDDQRAALVAKAWNQSCRQTLRPGAVAKLRCWSAEAWLDERAGRLEAAQIVHQRILSALKNPNPLGRFLTRRNRCLKLERILRRWERRSDATERVLELLREHSRRCAGQSIGE